MSIAIQFVETLARPGVLGLIGRRLEIAAQHDLETYFTQLARRIDGANLGFLVTQNQDSVMHAVDMKLQNILRITGADLQNILMSNIYIAMLRTDRINPLAEAEKVTVTDKLGLSGEEAAAYAKLKAAELVVDINNTTKQIIADAVSAGIQDQLGVDSTARLIRAVLTDMTKSRSRTIATTEMNAAMSKSTLLKLERNAIPYKQVIPSADACPICLSVIAAGPVPVTESFYDDEGDAYDSTPIHPNCRCATTGALAPQEN